MKRRRSLLAGILILSALVLILLVATVTSGAVDGFEIAVALILLVVSYLLQRDVREQTTYAQPPDVQDDDSSTTLLRVALEANAAVVRGRPKVGSQVGDAEA